METHHLLKNPHLFKKHKKLIISVVFLAVLSFLIFTSFSDFSFTGKVIGGNAITEKLSFGENFGEGIEFESEFSTIPDLVLSGNFKEFELSGNSNSYLKVGNQKFSLDKIKNNLIIFEDFSGEVSLNYWQITKLNGRVSEVIVNGVSLFPSKKESTTKVSFEKEFNYKSLEINEIVSIDEINYVTSGTIKLNGGKEIFNVDNEEVSIKGFNGDINIKKGKISLDGEINKLSLLGESKIIIEK